MSAQQLFQQAIQLHNAGDLAQAEALCRQILAQDPHQPAVYQRLAAIAHQRGEMPAAEAHLRQAIKLQPQIPENYMNLAVVLSSQSRIDEALAAARQALALRPNEPRDLANLSSLLHQAGQFHEGVNIARRALELTPNLPEAFNNLGINLAALGLLERAEVAYKQAIAASPNFAQAYNNLGVALQTMGRAEESASACAKAAQLDPRFAPAHTNLGNALQDLAAHRQAVDSYRRALELQPHNPSLQSNYLFASCYSPSVTPELFFREACGWAQSLRFPPQPAPKPIAPTGKLRIGYVSGDLRLHSVCYFLLPLLQHHDKSNFHITAYPTGVNADDITRQLQAAADQWRPLALLTDDQAADLIRRDNIDILVDLSGHTARNRLHVFARKPAPIQISWLGYPATTGLTQIDYRLTDVFADPPGDPTENFYAEKILRLPRTAWCFAPLSGSPEITPPPHLSQGHITFGSLNNFAKLNEETFHLWATLLERVPNSRLQMKTPVGPQTAARIHNIFHQHHVTPDCLDLLHKIPQPAAHLQRYRQIDIALDTFPYNGTTTTCEALWMGVPVITRAGTTHASRVGASLLTNAGFPDLIARTPEEFLDIATRLANDSAKLQSLRQTLRPQLQQSPLTNAAQFARDIESSYHHMRQQFLAGNPRRDG